MKKVLVIDDSTDYRKLLLNFFNKAYPDSEIVEFDPESGKPAESFPWHDYDLVILDYDLGKGGNGLEWLRNYKTSDSFPATLMLTAHGDEEIVVKAIRFGAQGFLRKSGLTKSALVESIGKALKKHHEEKKFSSTTNIRVHIFNKERFLKSLQDIQKGDCILLIEIDKYNALQEELGIFGSDDFINFVTDSISQFMEETNHHASMTRIGDSVIALLIKKIPGNDNVEDLARKLCRQFDELKYLHNGTLLEFSFNTGLTLINEDKIDLNVLLEKVEQACRKSRHDEGNSFTINSYGEYIAPATDDEIRNEILTAFNDENIQPLFQTLVNVSGANNPVFSELYQVRSHLIGPDNHELSAKKFIPVLKQQDLLKRYDRWMIRYCIKVLSELQLADNQKFGIFIPLSDYSFTDNKLTDWMDKALALAGSLELATSLIFEFNAGRFLEKARATKLQINKLRVKQGASIALSGIEDLATLDKCLSQEKFDFVIFSPEHTGDNGMDQGTLQEIATLCQRHKTLSVASKISTGECLASSASAGIDFVLGHFVQPPMERIIPTEQVEV